VLGQTDATVASPRVAFAVNCAAQGKVECSRREADLRAKIATSEHTPTARKPGKKDEGSIRHATPNSQPKRAPPITTSAADSTTRSTDHQVHPPENHDPNSSFLPSPHYPGVRKMAITERISQPYNLDLQFRGFIEGLTYIDRKTQQQLCHYFGGIPYALPPVGPFRFKKPRALPACYRYGTRANPGRFTGGCSMCPQPGCDPSQWDEDCLQMNVWIPAGNSPSTGWPVLFWIHGGFLQFGEPGSLDPCAMLSETACKAIIVAPGYRLNIFGFLASPELLDASCDIDANNGFWDQRAALEWTWQNINFFGGDASNITIGGYSAGSHSTFQQLAYDLGVPDAKAIARRALMLSNGPGMQPKSMPDAQVQFDEFTAALQIPASMTPAEKLATLRSLAPKTLIEATHSMKYHQFRGVTDGAFIRHGLLAELDTGLFAERMKRRDVKLIMGECRDEHFVYGTWHTPSNSYESLFERLQADYPLAASKALMEHYFPGRNLPPRFHNWQDAFGHVYADIQIHHLERGMAHALVAHGAAHLLYRYRMEWRAQCCDKNWAPEVGVTHGTDMASVWFWGDGERLSTKEKVIVRSAFHDLFACFVKGEAVEWGTERDAMLLRTLKPDGKVEIEEDTRLEEGLKVWEVLRKVGATGSSVVSKL